MKYETYGGMFDHEKQAKLTTLFYVERGEEKYKVQYGVCLKQLKNDKKIQIASEELTYWSRKKEWNAKREIRFSNPFYDMDKEMNNTEKKLYGKKAGRIMKTDIKEQKDGYELMIDLPGFTKDEIKASVSDGYLTISAAKGLDKDEKEKDSGHYIRRERYAGACQRSFYVGEDIEQEDVKAEFKHGILKLFVPKKEAKKAVEENKYIAIEG